MNAKVAREMSDDERIAWGRQEAEARKSDLSIRTAAGLAAAQANAETRGKEIMASRSWAAVAVSDALRHERVRSTA